MIKNLNKYIQNNLKKLKIKKNDHLLVYADLSKFGINNNKLPDVIISSLKKIIGKKGTLVMPFYILEKRQIVFNKKKFIFSKKISSLSKKFCQYKKIQRSKCLIHNHIGIGFKAKILNNSKENISIGAKSDFEYMMENDFKLVLLGCEPVQGATYLHHLEAIHGVPYRKWINVKKKKLENGKIKNVSINYFAKKNKKYISNFNYVFNMLKNKRKVLHSTKIKYGRNFCIKLKNLHDFGSMLLKKNKYAFIKESK
jgi:aminoglycoside N3'-acetyltransferase